MGLRTSVELDASGVQSGTAIVKKELTKADQALDKTKQKFYSAEDAVDAFAAAQISAGRTINDQSQILNAQGKVLTGATTRYATLTAQVDKFEKEIKTFNPALHQTGERIAQVHEKGKNFNSTFNQMGYQVQDFAMQVQSGGNVMQAATMQIGGMAQAINPIAGAVVTLGGVLAMTLLPSLFDAGNEAETVSDNLDKATRAMEVNADGTFTLGDDLQRLNRINTALGDSFLRTANIQATVAAKAANKEMFGTLTDTLPMNYVGAALTGNIRLTDGATKAAARFQSILLEGQKAGKLSTDQTLELNRLMGQLAPLTDKATKNHLAISEAITKNALAQSELNDLMKFTSQTQTELNASGSNTVVIDREAAQAKREKTQAQKEANEAEKEALKIHNDTVAMLAEDEQRNVQVTTQFNQIGAGMLSPLDKQAADEQAKIDLIETYRMLDVENEKAAQLMLTAVVKQGELDRAGIHAKTSSDELANTVSMFGSMSTIAEQFAGEGESRNKAAFAAQKIFSIASGGLAFSGALMKALDDPTAITMPQKLANMAMVASTGGSLLNSITSASYATGGLITNGSGTGQSDSVPINASAGEFIVNARKTRQYRSTLEAINSGSMSGGSMSGSATNVIVNNYGNDNVSVETAPDGDIVLTITEQINKQVPGLIGQEMNNPNSAGRRSLNSNYRMQRA